jgi:enterobactin synthetase component D
VTPPLAFARDGAFGRLAGVALPDEADDAAVAALVAALPAEERAHALGLLPARRVTWTGGRLALRAALDGLGVAAGPLGPILATPRGAPALPDGVVGSISHKRALAIALAARAEPRARATLGVDLELEGGLRVDISRRVLAAAEQARLDALASPEARGRELMIAFAAKEAIYKALDPWLGRHIPFREVEIERADDATLRGAFSPRAGEPSFTIELAEERVEGFLVVAARCRPSS